MTPFIMRAAQAAAIKICWLLQVTTKSDYARSNATVIASCASEGFLTTRVDRTSYSRIWLPTPTGLEFLGEVDPEVEF